MLVKDQINKAYEVMKESQGYTNPMQAVRIEKIVVNTGTGKRSRLSKDFNTLVSDRLAKITGQKPIIARAKQSIAGFKIRTGDPIGQKVTLRGARMYGFLNKLIHVALPRTKDFRGVKLSSVDSMGNLSMGLKENTIFPETTDEEVRDVFGFSITIVTSATSRDEAMVFFNHIGIPFQKEQA